MSRPKNSKDKKIRKRKIPFKSLELIGKKINRWTILDIDNSNGKNIKLHVKCECGTECIRNYTTIAYGKSKSCGCYHSEEMSQRQIKPENESAKRRLFNDYKLGAKTRNIIFDLTFDEVYDIANKKCYYCNKSPERIIATIGGIIQVNGIDRVDNSLGYIKSNCVPCCSECNLKKREVSKEIIYKAYKFLFGYENT